MARPYKVPEAAAATRTLPPSATSRLPDPSTATSSSSSVCAFTAGPPSPARPCCPTPTGVVRRPVRRLTARIRPPLSSRPTLMPAVSRSVKYTWPRAKLTPHPSLAKASPHRLTDTLLAGAGPPTPPAIVETVPAAAAGPAARPAPASAREAPVRETRAAAAAAATAAAIRRAEGDLQPLMLVPMPTPSPHDNLPTGGCRQTRRKSPRRLRCSRFPVRAQALARSSVHHARQLSNGRYSGDHW